MDCRGQIFGHNFPIPNSDCTNCGINQVVLSKSTEPKISKGDREYAEVKKALSKSKIKYGFQELGIEMQMYFKQNIWWIFHKYNLHDIRVAFKERQRESDYKLNYLLADLNKANKNRDIQY